MQIEVSLDWEGFTEKPSSEKQYKDYCDRRGKPLTQSTILGSRVGRRVIKIDLVNFAELVTEKGYTWSPFVFSECPETKKIRRKEHLFKSCQVLGLDFDDNFTLEKILKRCEQNQLKPNLIHQSFRSSPEHLKFRTIFVLDKVICSSFEVRLRIKKLLEIFPEADPVAKDLARLFYGSNKGIDYIDTENTNNICVSEADRSREEEKIEEELKRMLNKKGEGFNYGDLNTQKIAIQEVSPEQREFLSNRIRYFTNKIILFGGCNQGGEKTSRYELIFDATEKLTGLKGLQGSYIKVCLLDAIARNNYFNDWGYDPNEVIESAMVWKSKKPDIASGFEFDIKKYKESR